MAIVSILIPGFRAQYLKQTLSSAIQQTFDDIEILVGDDSKNGDLKYLVEMFDDPRIKYFHHGFQDGAKNSARLWQRANGQYIKWLYDDDVLMPTSVEMLVGALRANPASFMAFHGRIVIDGNGAVIQSGPPLLGDGQTASISKAFLVEKMIGGQNNFIGEPSNIMFNKDLVDVAHLYRYRSWDLMFLADVASYLYAAETAPIIAVGGQLSAFRRHAGQNSSINSPFYSAGLFEWELLLRGEARSDGMSHETLARGRHWLSNIYQGLLGRFPEFQGFIDGLHEFDDLSGDLLETPQFRDSITRAREALLARVNQQNQAAKPLPCVCSVCGQHAEKWIPHPESQRPNTFLTLLESVGSILDKHNCPNCYCNDRDRHLWLYMNRTALLKNLSAKRILHIAPEARLEPLIAALRPLEYVRGDLFPRSPGHRKIDIEALEFPDGYFDLIICNHVLEHVNHPETALAEFHRCLASGGHVVAQTPYSPKLKRTFEMTAPISVPFATLFFGQDDHVRLFGGDIVDYFHAAGLKGELLAHATVLGDIDADLWGCNVREPFFLFAKDHDPASSV